MRYVEKLTNIDPPTEYNEPPDLLGMMVKIQDQILFGIPYKKNRSARLQKKMQKIVRGMNERATIATNANAVPQSSAESP